MKTNLLKYYIAAFYFCSTFVLMAQPGTEDDNGTGSLEGGDPVPVDGYVWVLAAIGLIYVYLKLRALSHKGNSPQE
jgi:hypothetical protein